MLKVVLNIKINMGFQATSTAKTDLAEILLKVALNNKKNPDTPASSNTKTGRHDLAESRVKHKNKYRLRGYLHH